jgi:hypothetical protein
MKPVIRYQSQLLYRKSYKPARVIRVRPDARSISRRPKVIWQSENFPVAIQPEASPTTNRLVA